MTETIIVSGFLLLLISLLFRQYLPTKARFEVRSLTGENLAVILAVASIAQLLFTLMKLDIRVPGPSLLWPLAVGALVWLCSLPSAKSLSS